MRRMFPAIGALVLGIGAILATPSGTGAGMVWSGTLPAVRFLIGAPAAIVAMVVALARSWNSRSAQPLTSAAEAFVAVAIYQVCGAYVTGMGVPAVIAVALPAFGQAAFGTAVSQGVGILPATARWPAAIAILVGNAVFLPVVWRGHPLSVVAHIVQAGRISTPDLLRALGSGFALPVTLAVIAAVAVRRWGCSAAIAPGDTT